MCQYKHYSFDLWSTLIRSNPRFKESRALYFYERFNYKGKLLSQVKEVFRQVDIMCNTINEKTGGNIESEEMYLIVINLLNDFDVDLAEIDVYEIYQHLEMLLFEFSPEVYCSDTHSVLTELKGKEGVSMNVLSNTAFIKGKTLRTVLKSIGLDAFFDFQLYSDELGVSKPNRAVFEKLIQTAGEFNTNLLMSEILHVGDNPVADVKGAQYAGINSLLINSNNNSILTVLN